MPLACVTSFDASAAENCSTISTESKFVCQWINGCTHIICAYCLCGLAEKRIEIVCGLRFIMEIVISSMAQWTVLGLLLVEMGQKFTESVAPKSIAQNCKEIIIYLISSACAWLRKQPLVGKWWLDWMKTCRWNVYLIEKPVSTVWISSSSSLDTLMRRDDDFAFVRSM